MKGMRLGNRSAGRIAYSHIVGFGMSASEGQADVVSRGDNFRNPIPDFRPKNSFRNGRLPFTMSGREDECNFAFTLSPYRQDTLKDCTRGGSKRGPYSSPISFDDRSSDR